MPATKDATQEGARLTPALAEPEFERLPRAIDEEDQALLVAFAKYAHRAVLPHVRQIERNHFGAAYARAAMDADVLSIETSRAAV